MFRLVYKFESYSFDAESLIVFFFFWVGQTVYVKSTF